MLNRTLELQTEFKGSGPCLPLPRVSWRLAEVLGKRVAGKMGWAGQGRLTQTYSRAAVEGPER